MTEPTIAELLLNVEMAKSYWDLYKRKGWNDNVKDSKEFTELGSILDKAIELAKQLPQ